MNQETIKILKTFNCILIKINEEITSCLKDKSPNYIQFFKTSTNTSPEDITMDKSKPSNISSGLKYTNGLDPVSGSYIEKTDDIDSIVSNDEDLKDNAINSIGKLIMDIPGESDIHSSIVAKKDKTESSNICSWNTIKNDLPAASGSCITETDKRSGEISSDKNIEEDNLDPNEKLIIDISGVTDERWKNWKCFRSRIGIGTNSKKLVIDTDKLANLDTETRELTTRGLKQLYLALGYAHYEIVMSIGMARIALLELKRLQSINLLARKSLKEFYVHLCSALDNFARLIFIIGKDHTLNIKQSICYQKKIGWNAKNSDNYMDKYYAKYDNKKHWKTKINEILTIRNNLAHNWLGVFKPPVQGHKFLVPKIIKKEKNIPWGYDDLELNNLEKMGLKIDSGSDWEPAEEIMKDHYDFFISFQSNLFDTLIDNVEDFEKNNNVKIIC